MNHCHEHQVPKNIRTLARKHSRLHRKLMKTAAAEAGVMMAPGTSCERTHLKHAKKCENKEENTSKYFHKF